ncbi:hypothetical protein BC830DRAFT_518739 [Chytriomyces sp. MP71]|nr:hypothetical protein BC830DRAFT_518739 [Chytriomyces sp. MP71]
MVEHAESADYESDRENSALDMSPKRSVEDASGDTQERNSIEESQDHEDDPADEDSSFREIISNSDIGNNPDMITLDDGIEEDIQESLAQETSTSQSAKSGHKHFETSQVSDVNKQRQEQHNQNKSESSIDGTSDSIPETQLEKLEVRPKGGVNLFQIADEEGSEVVFVMEAGVSETESNEAASFPKPSHDLVETGTHSPTPIESGTQVSFKTKTKAIPFSKGATKSKTKTKGMPVPSATKESTLWVGTNSHVNATFQGNGTSLYSSNNSISSFDSEVFLKDKKRTSQSETNNGTMTERDHLLPNSDKTLSVPPEDPSSSSLISNKVTHTFNLIPLVP